MSKRKSARSSGPEAQAKKTFALPAECLIATSESLRQCLVDLAKAADVTLDASAVQRIDTACLQLLTAFIRERRAAEQPTSWVGVPASLVDRAQLLGLSSALAFDGAVREGGA